MAVKFDSPFRPIFPSRTAGSGRVRSNSARDGGGQGRGSSKRFAPCQQCGFINNIRAIVISGGGLSGDGARGAITKTDSTGTTLDGSSVVQKFGDAALRKGAGCPVCFSKNSVKDPAHKNLISGTSTTRFRF